jgi:hypothetical protein
MLETEQISWIMKEISVNLAKTRLFRLFPSASASLVRWSDIFPIASSIGLASYSQIPSLPLPL